MTAAEENGGNLAGIVCLIIGPDAALRSSLRAVLSGYGAEIILEADDAAAGLRSLLGRRIDVILVDDDLAVVTAADFVRFLRSGKGVRRNDVAPVVILGSGAFATDADGYRNIGVDAYLVKPAQPEELYGSIRRIVFGQRTVIRVPDYTGPDRRRADAGPPGGIERRRPRSD